MFLWVRGFPFHWELEETSDILRILHVRFFLFFLCFIPAPALLCRF
jgi:hypothetical protein